MKTDFSIIITAHNEKEYLNDSLNHVTANIDFFRGMNNDFKYEIIIVLDSPDSLTKSIAVKWVTSHTFARIIEVKYLDVGKSRNFGINISSFDLIYILDGDDCWGKSWISRSINFINKQSDLCLLHPELVLYKGVKLQSIRKHTSSRSDDFDPWILSFENVWTSSTLCRREVFNKISYPSGATLNDNPYAYEDWSFNRESLNSGIHHLVVAKTCHLVNQRASSNTKISKDLGQSPWPTDLFLKMIEEID